MTKTVTDVGSLSFSSDLWQKLSRKDKPLVLYGMGNGADKVIDALNERDISFDAVFASDEFVRGQSFHGKKVMTYREVCETFGDFRVAVCFGTHLPEVMAKIGAIGQEHELLMPDVPVVPDEDGLFDLTYFEKHRAELTEVCDLLADEKSKQTFCDILSYRITGDPAYLVSHTVDEEECYRLLGADKFEAVADLGAYDGDSLRTLSAYAPRLSRAVALEPDARTFKKLSAFAESVSYRLDAYNAAAWNEDTLLSFTSGGNRNSTLSSADALKTGAKVKEVRAAKLDSLYGDGRCDYIKYDVEGAEYEAILGSRGLIAREKPALLVSLYHRTGDLVRLPLLVSELGYSKLFLRRLSCFPAWELNLLAIS